MYIFSKIKHLLVCFEDILSIDNQVDTTSGRGCTYMIRTQMKKKKLLTILKANCLKWPKRSKTA